jgi:hypothetical protein
MARCRVGFKKRRASARARQCESYCPFMCTSETYRDVCSGGGYRGMSGLLVDIANPSRLTQTCSVLCIRTNVGFLQFLPSASHSTLILVS